MTKDMSTMTTENLKSYIVADRMTVLNAIAKDCASVSTKDAANWVKTFSQRVEGYMAIAMPEVADKKRKKKVNNIYLFFIIGGKQRQFIAA